jgi:hypothetical protein
MFSLAFFLVERTTLEFESLWEDLWTKGQVSRVICFVLFCFGHLYIRKKRGPWNKVVDMILVLKLLLAIVCTHFWCVNGHD